MRLLFFKKCNNFWKKIDFLHLLFLISKACSWQYEDKNLASTVFSERIKKGTTRLILEVYINVACYFNMWNIHIIVSFWSDYFSYWNFYLTNVKQSKIFKTDLFTAVFHSFTKDVNVFCNFCYFILFQNKIPRNFIKE